jgi:hypothetical protein
MDMEKSSVITRKHLEVAYTYEEYRTMLDELLARDQTTGPKQTPELVQYTKLNIQRMHRWDKTAILNQSLLEKLALIQDQWIWLVLTEGWCGDAAQSVPVIAKMAQASENISLKLLLRDQNLDIMDEYLSNGARSIPKLICLQADTLSVIGSLGSRPAILQDMVMEHKKNPQMSNKEFIESVHAWYARDKSQHLQQEFEDLIVKWSQKQYVS